METQKDFLLSLENSIKKEATNVLGRIFLFLVYYIGLIILGILLLWGAWELTAWVVTVAIPSINSIRALILVVLILAGVWSLALMLGLYLVKPLFSFSRSENIDRVEIKEEDAPELFAMIRDVAQKTECPFPKHVYLNTNINACVFYNTTFWSIFFPVRKNLEIGLGLFHSTNVDEVKAIIAHEFGHFSQKSMKVGSTVYVVNQVLYNLIYTEDSFDRRIDNWCMSETTLWAIFGSITRFVTNQVKHLTFYMYTFVQRGYLRLSRQMEYEADAIACQAVGSKPFISSMCKIDYTSDRTESYERFLQELLNGNKCVDNYWEGYSEAVRTMVDYDGVHVDVEDELTKPLAINRVHPSRVNVKNVWASHPSLEDRINQAVLLDYSVDTPCTQSSWSLIPESMKDKMSAHKLDVIKGGLPDKTELGIVDGKAFGNWMSGEVENHFIPLKLKPFFNREFAYFDMEELSEEKDSPFTEDNACVLLEYQTALDDMNLLQGIRDGQIEVEELRYDGNLYKKKGVSELLQQHEQYLKGLHEKAVVIDKWIYSYIYRRSEDINKVKNAYASIFYVRSCRNMFNQIMQSRNNLINELNLPIRHTEDSITNLCRQINDTEKVIRKCLSNLDYRLLSLVVKPEVIEDINSYAAVSHNPTGRVDIDTVKEMVDVFDTVMDMHRHLSRTAYSMVISEVVDKTLANDANKDDEKKPIEIIKEEVIDHNKIKEVLYKELNELKSKRKQKRSIWIVASIVVSIILGNLLFSTNKDGEDSSIFSDELMVFKSPLGLECEKMKDDDGHGFFSLTNDNVGITLMSGYVSGASDEEFENSWKNWKEPELESYHQELIDRRNLVMRRYNYQYKSVRYDNENAESIFWEFAILYNEDETKACLCSIWSANGTINYMDEILSSVRFK